VPPPQSYPSGDYTYVLEIVMRMQESVGRLTEAVGSLKEQSKNHGEKLEQIGRDIHTAKTTVKVVGGIIAAVIGIAGWMVHGGLGDLVQILRQQPTIQQSQPK
jgi:hypothetical protein